MLSPLVSFENKVEDAIKNNNKESLTKILQDNIGKVTDKKLDGWTIIAVSNDSFDALTSLLEKYKTGKNYNSQITHLYLEAIKANKGEILEKMLYKYSAVHPNKNELLNFLLVEAINSGKINSSKALISVASNKKILKNSDWDDKIHTALQLKEDDIANCLLKNLPYELNKESKSDVEKFTWWAKTAIKNQKISTLEILLNKFDEQGLLDNDKLTELFISAIRSDKMESIEFFINKYDLLNEEKFKINPLGYAASFDTMKFFLEKGFNFDSIEFTQKYFQACLNKAIKENNSEFAQIFIDKGANPNLATYDELPIEHAKTLKMAKVLITNGATVDDNLWEKIKSSKETREAEYIAYAISERDKMRLPSEQNQDTLNNRLASIGLTWSEDRCKFVTSESYLKSENLLIFKDIFLNDDVSKKSEITNLYEETEASTSSFWDKACCFKISSNSTSDSDSNRSWINQPPNESYACSSSEPAKSVEQQSSKHTRLEESTHFFFNQ